jgi:hypothetical protein
MTTSDSVLFYMVVIPAIVTFIIRLFALHRMKKHDLVLYRFCEIRRDLMNFLRDPAMNLDNVAYARTRSMLNVINYIIHEYDFCKRNLFNMRKFLNYFGEATKLATGLEKTGNSKMDGIANDLVFAVVEAFFQFTPFLRSEATFKIVQFFWKHLLSKMRDYNESIASVRLIRTTGHQLGIV